jgi:WD40 repeat protein
MLATASRDTERNVGNTLIGPEKGSARVWDLATGQERWRFLVEGLDARSLAFSPDGRLLAVAVTDATVRLYNLTSGQERVHRLGTELVKPLGGDIKGAPRQPSEIGCLAFSPDGTILAAGEARESDFSLAAIHLWDVARGARVASDPSASPRDRFSIVRP